MLNRGYEYVLLVFENNRNTIFVLQMLSSCRPLQTCMSPSQMSTASKLGLLQTRVTSLVPAKYCSLLHITTVSINNSISASSVNRNSSRIVLKNHTKHFSVGCSALQKLKPKETREVVESTEKPFRDLTTPQKGLL